MKVIIATIALAATVSSASAAPKCVQARDILSTHSDDGKLMTFKMRDGTTLVNHLQGTCSDLRFEGFAWNVPGTGEVCENQQSLNVLRSGQTCVLGKFDLVKDKPPAK